MLVSQLQIPDTVRHSDVLEVWLSSRMPLILCGPPGRNASRFVHIFTNTYMFWLTTFLITGGKYHNNYNNNSNNNNHHQNNQQQNAPSDNPDTSNAPDEKNANE